MRRTMAVVVLAHVGVARAAAAQVGYEPAESPYRDVEYRQGATAFAGYYSAALDPAGVAPRGGPMAGLRYDLHLTGPAQLTVRSAYVRTERNVIDPRQPPATRLLGQRSVPLLLSDVGITLNLTGQRSWHYLVPLLQFGGGIASDLRPATDVGNYAFGTTFALAVGAGVRWVPGGRFELRGEVTDHLYSIRYPSTYFQSTVANGNSPVLPSSSGRSKWRHNAGITLGVTYRFRR